MKQRKSIDTRTEEQRVSYDVKKYFKENNLKGKNVAEKLGISASLLSKLCAGNKFFPEEIAEKMHNLFGFDKYYLMHGSCEILFHGRADTPGISGEDTIITHTLIDEEAQTITQDFSGDALIQALNVLRDVVNESSRKLMNIELMARTEHQKLLSTAQTIRNIQTYLNNETLNKL